MNIERYNDLMGDPQVIKFGGWQGGYFNNPHADIVISLFFMHTGWRIDPSGRPEKRVTISIIDPEKLLVPILPKIIDKDTLFLMNADVEDYALSYRLLVDPHNNVVSLNLLDLPKIGDNIITQEERTGIVLRYRI